MWQIRLILIQIVIGYREYSIYQYGQIFGMNNVQCPDLHANMPDMHPHQCVSYASICQGVTEPIIKTQSNGTQYVCHPRFQPWGGGGFPYKDIYQVHCGFDLGISLVMELLSDGHYKYYCSSFYYNEQKRCLIFSNYQGYFNCLFCKFPFFGYQCSELNQGYDQRFTNPPRRCSGSCIECSELGDCSTCRIGFVRSNSQDNQCSLYCYGFQSCSYDSSNNIVYGTDCRYGYLKSVSWGQPACYGSYLPCLLPFEVNNYHSSCNYCQDGYYLTYLYPNNWIDKSCEQYDWNCHPSRQSVQQRLINSNYYLYYITCNSCDPGFYYSEESSRCSYVRYKPNKDYCILLDPQKNNCIACFLGFALQPDGSCKEVFCDQKCSTCLDTNPSYCTTCDSLENKIADNGICKCLPNSGMSQDNCITCTEGFCYECDQLDFYSCISCKSGQNRILANNLCNCMTGYYDPGNDDQICLTCDYSCFNCGGPTNQDCTECPDESTSNRIKIENACPCKAGYADLAIKESKCGLCHPRCKTCFQAADQTSNQYCLTCIPGQNRVVSETFDCECQVNSGDLNGILDVCIICHYTCGSCDGTENTNCISCSESSNRELTTTGECLCKLSYYDDNTDNIECQKCYYACITCSNSPEKDACLLCPPTRKPSSSGSNFECICSLENYFDDGFSPQCQQCDKNCLTCNGPLPSNCLTCDINYRQMDLSSCICPIEHYDIGFLECANCHYSCQQCFDNTLDSCITCSLELNFRVLKGNICKCIDGYYEENGIAKCKKCSYKCETCETSAEKCLVCPLNSLRILDPVKGCYCPGEYYDKQDEIACQRCHFKCKSCNGRDQNNCLTCDSVAYREFIDNECKCKPHYFEMEVQECTACSALCYECASNFEKCTSCNDDRYLIDNTCKCITKLNGGTISTFEYNGMIKCQKCHYSCGTCGGIEEGDCITCMETEQRLQVGNTCVCKEGYFDAGLPDCQKCSYKCKGCSKQSESCTSCVDNSFRQYVSGFNKCQCIQKYYDDGVNEVCKQCHYSCLRCNEIETKCELCSTESNRIYNDQFFSCDCNIGYYDAGVEICQNCHYSCLTCSSGDANSCISCVDMNTSKRVFYNNTCQCLFGYFDDGKSIECQKCDIKCLSCFEQSYSCLSCPQTRKIETNCQCQLGYYDVGLQLCSKCNSNCLTCSITSKNCTSCDSYQFRELNLLTFTCDCLQGYIEINGICEQCYSSCKTCSQTINKCTSCVQYRYLKNNDCICNDGMFESNVDKLCKLCDRTCLTCGNSNTYCLTCSIENFRQFNSGNTCECLQGYFEDPVTLNCEQCLSSCLTCALQYDNCTSCDTNYNLALINNKCVCAKSYYFDPLTTQCEQCNIRCLECQNSNECTQCRLTTRHYSADLKNCLCNDGYYETNQQNCQQCHLSCGTCQNVNTYCLTCLSEFKRIFANNTCLCQDGYYDAGIEMCQKCNNVCKTCQSSASTCLSCYDIEHYRYFSGNKCLCKAGYYESNTDKCSKCSNECLTCQGLADYCTSCDTNSKRIDQSIIHKCPCIFGFYQDQNSTCQKCHIKCQSCVSSADQCLSCNFQSNSNRLTLSDLCNCKEGYYDDGTQLQCQLCNFRCKTCIIQENNCQNCSNLIRTNPPTCNCMDGYYEDEQLICQSCASQCSTCISQPSNCLSCNPGRIGQDCKCIDGYFEIGLILCSQCAFQCATCELDPLNCKTCKGDRFQEPQCICQFGYFDDQINEDCQLCDMTCIECNINGCLSCSANRILNEDMDCLPPPNSIFYHNTPWCSTCEVAVIKAYLSDDLTKIIIHFDFPLNPKGFSSQVEVNKCLQIFEVEFVQSLGQNSVCYLNSDDNQELLISLGDNSKILVGDKIQFKSNTLSQINCEITLQIFILDTLQMPINPLPPQIQYNVPLHKLNPLADNSVYLKSIKNYGNRKLDNIIWACQVISTDDSSTLNQYLDQLNFVQEYNLLIPKLTLPKDAQLTFKIQYENFIHISSYSEFIIYTHSGALPQVNIYAKPSYFVYQTISMGVSAGNSDQSNSKDNSKYQIQLIEIDRNPSKSLSSQLNTSVQSNSFEMIYSTIPKYTLSPNSTYTFLVTATNIITNQVQYENFTIDIPFAGFICQFSNRGIQSIRKDLNLQIECKDLDTIFDWNSDPDLSIQVACKDLQINSTCQNEQKQIINVNSTTTYQFIKRNSISTFTVQEWSVTVTKFLQTQKFSLIIVYLDDDFPIIDLEFNKGYLMRKINNYEQLNFTFLIPFEQKPYLLDLSIAIIYNYEIIEILQPKFVSHQFKIFNSIKELNLGDEVNIKFAAQYTNNIMPSLNNIKLSVNQPPQCSKLFITRSNNLALTDIIIASTCDLSNDSPYKYQLKLFLRDSDLTDFLQGSSDNSLILYPFQAQNLFSIQTPTSIDSSKIGILVQVLDNGGSMSQIFEQITVKPAKINCTSIQYQNLNLQSKISLLFEAMNQKCVDLHSKIYLNLLQQSMSEDSNDNILKFQSLKLYKQSLIQSIQSEPQDNLTIDRCFDINSTHIFITQNSTQPEVNLTDKIENLKQNTNTFDKTLKYFRKLKKQFQDDLQLNQYTWNEQVFQQYQSSQECLRSLLYYLDDIYSNFSSINQQNELLYQAIVELSKFIPLISEETQNTIIVNQEPLIVNGNEIIWQIKRRTKSSFNQLFDIEPAKEDFLVDYIQFESLQFQTNPLRFSSELQDLLKTQFNDSTLQIYQQNYYLTQLKNVYHNRFISYENFSSIYGTKFGSYQVCKNTTQFLSEYEIQCVTRTVSGKLYQCHLNKVQNIDSIELICECNKFGDIFLQTSTNFSIRNENMTSQSLSDLQIVSTSDNFLTLEICTGSLSFIFMAIYTIQIYKDYKIEEERSNTEQMNLSPRNNFQFNKLTYQGNFRVFKDKFKQIHQTISLFIYKDNSIQLSYRILEVLSQFNLLLTLAIVEFEMLDNYILFICLFIILNPVIILIMRFTYKIIEAMYRFKRAAAFISQFLLIVFLMTPNLITYVLNIMKITIQTEEYKVAIIFMGNILVSQVLLEPLTIFGRIFIYRLIAKSMRNMELNPVFHLMHFLAMHSSLEEIFEDFTRI